MDEYTTEQLLRELQRRGTAYPDLEFSRAMIDFTRQLLCTLPIQMLDFRPRDARATPLQTWADLVQPDPARNIVQNHGPWRSR